MGAYVLRRLVVFVPMLVAISLVTFTLINVAPGDPISAMISPEEQLRKEDFERLRASLGLNKPLPVRYVLWLGQLLRGNFGYSTYTRRPVLERIGPRVLPTIELMMSALVVATTLGIVLGVAAAIRQYSVWDYLLSIVSLFGISIPAFFFALISLYIFAAKLEVLPTFGMSSGARQFSLGDNLMHLILPAAVLSIDLLAATTRYARTAMLEVIHSDYVRTARAKGLTEFVVIGRHAFRNALLPLITITTLRLPLLLGGALVVETIFSWPGMGSLAIDAIHQRDYPTLMGMTFFVASLVLVANLVADVLYAYADPRIRVS